MPDDQLQLPEEGSGDATVHRPSSRASSISSRSIHSTRSLLSTDLTHVEENGRTYPNDTYYMPCDALEQTRLEILHRLYLTALNGALTTAPISPGIHRVLDVGTGPGEWASQMAEQFPDAEIVAVDLAVWELPPVARQADDSDSDDDEVDPRANVIWEIDDLEPCCSNAVSSSSSSLKDRLAQTTADIEGLAIDQGYASGSTTKTPSEPRSPAAEGLDSPPLSDDDGGEGWNFSETFDFVHIRDLKGAFRDWSAVYREAFVSLAPGGLIEVVEIMPDFVFSEDSVTNPTNVDPGSALSEMAVATIKAAAATGRPLSTDHLEPALFEAAGFTDVKQHVVDVPLGPWPDDERRAVMGKMWLVACAEGIEAWCLRLLTAQAGWSLERVREMTKRAREEILEGRHGGMVTKLVFLTARKARRRKDKP